ncbi:MAG TPA: T9SS type A sorting domain-containing protein [Candidatus Eisenbacteria bacterium]|nr:T9SS type A sorting domain-containing protein [Candidatus Eisenbacteria bacterium]
MSTVRLILIVLAMSAGLENAWAASVPYTDRGAFLAATSAVQTITFEGLLPPDAVPGMYFVPFNGTPQLLGATIAITSQGCFGNFGPSSLGLALDEAGTFLLDRLGDAPCETLLVTLPSEVTAFGFEIDHRGGFGGGFPPQVILSNGFSFDSPISNGFVGVTSDQPFRTARIVSPLPSHLLNASYDDFTFGSRAGALNTSIDINPEVLNPRSQGPWVSVSIEIPDRDPATIDLTSVRVGGLTVEASTARIGDHDGDTIPDLTVKVARPDLVDGRSPGTHSITVTGRLSTGESFEGMDAIRVLSPGQAAALKTIGSTGTGGLVQFRTTRLGSVTLELFDVAGRRVARTDQAAVASGEHSWDAAQGRPMRAGVYFYRLKTVEGTLSGKTLMMR